MPMVHEPRLQLLQFNAHLTPLLGPKLAFCALLFRELTMLDFLASVSRARPSFPSMELTAAHRESSGTLA